MKKLIKDLVALQEVELEIFKAESGLDNIPAERQELESILDARKKAIDDVDSDIAELEERRKPLEAELEENQVILSAADARIKKIKTNKEFLALQREIDVARKRKIALEEQLLGLMDKVEKRCGDRERIEKSFVADKGVIENKASALDSRAEDLKAVIDKYHDRAAELREKVDRSLLSKYDRIKNNRKGLAVVACADGVCGGCHMHIPPQLFNELVRGDEMILCPACQRILYVEEIPE